MELILVRHGETLENIKGIIQGQTDGTLSQKGIVQAKELGSKLKNEKIDAIYCSDLGRCKDTSKEIVKYFPKVSLCYTKDLRERGFGRLTGTKLSEVDWNNLPKDVETNGDLQNRARDFIKSIRKDHSLVLIVGHRRINNAIITVINKEPVEQIDKMKIPDNASIARIHLSTLS